MYLFLKFLNQDGRILTMLVSLIKIFEKRFLHFRSKYGFKIDEQKTENKMERKRITKARPPKTWCLAFQTMKSMSILPDHGHPSQEHLLHQQHLHEPNHHPYDVPNEIPMMHSQENGEFQSQMQSVSHYGHSAGSSSQQNLEHLQEHNNNNGGESLHLNSNPDPARTDSIAASPCTRSTASSSTPPTPWWQPANNILQQGIFPTPTTLRTISYTPVRSWIPMYTQRMFVTNTGCFPTISTPTSPWCSSIIIITLITPLVPTWGPKERPVILPTMDPLFSSQVQKPQSRTHQGRLLLITPLQTEEVQV